MFSKNSCDKAHQNYMEGNYEEALENVERCLQLLRRKSFMRKNNKTNGINNTDIVKSKLLEGKILLKLGKVDEAEDIYMHAKSLIVGPSKKNDYMRGELFYFLRDVASTKGYETEALAFLEQSKKFFVKAEAYRSAIDVMFEFEEYDKYSNDQDQLTELYKEIHELSKMLDDREVKREISARVRLEIGKLLKTTDVRKASSSLIKAQKDFSTLDMDSSKFQVETLLELAEIRHLSDVHRSIEILQDALLIATEDYSIHRSHIKLARYYLIIGEEQNAMHHLEEGMKVKVDQTLPLIDDLLELSKTTLLMTDNSEILEIGESLTADVLESYDEINNKEGKIMAHLLQGIYSYFDDSDVSNSKLQLIPYLAKNFDYHTTKLRTISFEIIPWITQKDQSEKSISLLRDRLDAQNFLELAEITHLYGLYLMIKGDPKTQNILEQSKEIYHKFHRNWKGVERAISKIDDQLTSNQEQLATT